MTKYNLKMLLFQEANGFGQLVQDLAIENSYNEGSNRETDQWNRKFEFKRNYESVSDGKNFVVEIDRSTAQGVNGDEIIVEENGGRV